MAKLQNRTMLLVGTFTSILVLWCNIAMVRSEDRVEENGVTFTDKLWTDDGVAKQGIQQSTNRLTAPKKPRFLCLHGHLSSATILEQQLKVWPESVTNKMEFVYINGSFPLDDDDGSSVNEHFGWFDFDKVNMDPYEIIEEGIAYIEDRMIELGPFDGLLGFSEGALVTASLPGLQKQGICLKKVEKIKHVIIISGGGYPIPELTEAAFTSPINIPSLHMFGENDIARRHAPELIEAYVDPLVLYHHGGHEVPKLDEQGLRIMYEFLEKINAIF